ncbi:uncharacterized protein LOC120081034 [Benincasa hispida]|uniref:uncharacterized protein LOC120081034 n=1 Tax=Benincasa hispida TaxID=102211 RepID=UPI0019010B10|nr:uncharacterized protein LOC120081034 [Benincasa hispida]
MIDIVLVINDLKFVLIEECPLVFEPNASRNVSDAYEKWIKANDKAKVYILVGLTKVLIEKHETMITAREIMESLCDMFGKPSSQAMHDALKFIFNAWMAERSSVREHVLNMMIHFNVVKMKGGLIKEPSQTFESLMKVKRTNGETNVAFSNKKFHKGLTFGTKSIPSSSFRVKNWKKKNDGKGNKAIISTTI